MQDYTTNTQLRINRQEIKRERGAHRETEAERERGQRQRDRDKERDRGERETEGESHRDREVGRESNRVTQREGQFGLAQSSWRAESLYDNLPTSKINHRSLPLSPSVSKLARPPN